MSTNHTSGAQHHEPSHHEPSHHEPSDYEDVSFASLPPPPPPPPQESSPQQAAGGTGVPLLPEPPLPTRPMPPVPLPPTPQPATPAVPEPPVPQPPVSTPEAPTHTEFEGFVSEWSEIDELSAEPADLTSAPDHLSAPSPTQAVPSATPQVGKALSMALANLWYVPVAILRGNIEDAFNRSTAVEEETGVGWVNWLFPALAFALSFALGNLATLWGYIRSIVAMFSDFLGEFGFTTAELLQDSGLGAGVFARIFFGSVAAGTGLILLWYTVGFLSAKYGGRPVPFNQAANGMSVAISVLWLPFLLSSIPYLIFPYTGAFILSVVLYSGAGLVAMILNYESVSRNGPFTKSPLVIYALLMTVASGIFVAFFLALLVPLAELKDTFMW